MTSKDDSGIGLEDVIGKSMHASLLSWVISRQVFWVSVAALLAFIFMSVASDVFATQDNLFNVTRNFSFVAGMSVIRFEYTRPRRIITPVEIVLRMSFCAVPAFIRVLPVTNSGPTSQTMG